MLRDDSAGRDNNARCLYVCGNGQGMAHIAIYVPPHDKTNKMACAPAKTQISLGIRPVWSVFTVRMKKVWVLSYPLSAQRRLWSDWADAQADLSLRWRTCHLLVLPWGGSYLNLHTRIRAVRPSTCNVVRNAFGHLIRAPHYFQTLG